MSEECIEDMKHNEKMNYDQAAAIKFHNAKCCCICNKAFKSKTEKVRDHDHITGKFRGAAHRKCNINFF